MNLDDDYDRVFEFFGGEPFLEFDAILKCIETIKAERIILVTSGFWAYNEINAEKYLKELYNSLSKNPITPRLTIRVSISEYHSIKLKEKPLVNLRPLRLFFDHNLILMGTQVSYRQ